MLELRRCEPGAWRTGRTFRTILKAVYCASNGKKVRLIAPTYEYDRNHLLPKLVEVLDVYGVPHKRAYCDRQRVHQVFLKGGGSIHLTTKGTNPYLHPLGVDADSIFEDEF